MEKEERQLIYCTTRKTTTVPQNLNSLNTVADKLLPQEVLENETDQKESEADSTQVDIKSKSLTNTINTGLNTLKPVPTQLLTVSNHARNPVHIELDSASTVNFISLDEARTRNFTIYPNSQSSKLGDGATSITAVGEITTTFYRDDLPLIYEAQVCKKLHCPVIGGTPFLKNNGIRQDFTSNLISLSKDKKIVPATTLEATLPIQPVQYTTVQNPEKNRESVHQTPVPVQNTAQTQRYNLMSIKSNKILMPGDSLDLNKELPDQTVVVEGWHPNHWPDPQLANIHQNKIQVTNTTNKPVLLTNKRINSIKITTTEDTDWTQPFLSTLKQKQRNVSPLSDSETIDTIQIGDTTADMKDLLTVAHRRYRKIFSKDLSGGYNGHYSRHECRLNWATAQRPEAQKIPIANYNRGLKGIMQEVCDELTEQGVLKIPQEHNIKVQSVCP